MELLIFINSGGPNINFINVYDTINSFSKKLGIDNYGFYYVTDTAENEFKILQIFKKLNLVDKIVELKTNNFSWAYNFNLFFDKYKDKVKYFIYSHDDLEIKTENFYNNAINEINKIDEKVGWITFTSDGYYKHLGLNIANSIREGFCIDRFKYPQVFECHNFSPNERFNENKLDFPKDVVKCHAPFPHLCLISNNALKDIGYCSDWSLYTLLIDEDWGMEALRKNYNNVWIPNIVYTHPLRPAQRKTQGVRYQNEVHGKFADKWGWNFDKGNYSDSFIKDFCNQYKDTNLTLTKDKFTYDWQYLRKK